MVARRPLTADGGPSAAQPPRPGDVVSITFR